MISSCQKKESPELRLFDSFLTQNQTFHTKRMHREKATHFDKAAIIPSIDTATSKKFEIRYTKLIAQLDDFSTSEESTIDELLKEYNQFMNDVRTVLNEYHREKFDANSKQLDCLKLDTPHRLKVIKNNLTLAMIFAYKSLNGTIFYEQTGGPVRIRTTVLQDEPQTKIILASKYLQNQRQQLDILVDKTVYKGFEKQLEYTIVPNYAFADIVLDSLTTGNYKIEGTVQYLDREGTVVIPFQEAFNID